jgi:2-iminobutanoate/2-iminopropanoate deaminase
MTTIAPILTGVAAHIGTYADAVAIPNPGTSIFVSGTPGLREDGTPLQDFTDEARHCCANVENSLGKAGAKLTDIVYMRQWLTSRDSVSAYLAVSKEIIHHQPPPCSASSTGWCGPTCAWKSKSPRSCRHERSKHEDHRPPRRHRRRRHRSGFDRTCAVRRPQGSGCP